MPRHLQKRRRKWYAMLDIPAAVRPFFGGRRRFVKTLETDSYQVAQARVGAVIAGWAALIASARSTAKGGDAEFFYKLLRTATTALQREAVMERVQEAADAVGYLHADIGQPPASTSEAQEFVSRATGGHVGTLEHVEEWLATLYGKPRTKDQRRTGARRVAEAFPKLRDINKPEVRKWAAAQDLSQKSIVIILGGMRVYWRWLQAAAVVEEGANPFEAVDLVRKAAAPSGDDRQPFTADQIVKLRAAAPDEQLRDLITLAMWTGARVEELCSLRVEHVGAASFKIVAAKTAAGVREVPIHPKLRQTITRLLVDSADGYLLSGLTMNRYGGRANTLGKRFSEYKLRQGFGPSHTFHSIRRTVVTQLQNAGAIESTVAAIVGHEIKTITYGLYSGGATLEVKAAALALLDYPEAP